MSPEPLWRGLQMVAADRSRVVPLARSIRDELYGTQGLDRAVGVSDVAKLFDCTVEARSDVMWPAHCCAMLIPTATRYPHFRILCRASDPPVRRRFSVAHEVAHIFFYDRTTQPAQRLRRGGSNVEEDFADDFAAELLLPRSRAVELFDNRSISSLVAIAKRYDVAPMVAALHLLAADVFPWKAILGLRFIGTRREPEPKAWRVEWSVSPRGVFIPAAAKYRQGPALEVVEDRSTYGDGEIAVGTGPLDLGSLRGAYPQQAMRVRSTTIVAVE